MKTVHWKRNASGFFVWLVVSGLTPGASASEDPVVADVRDGLCRMVITGQLAMFSLRAEGLKPGEPILFESVSNGERMAREAQAQADGTYSATLLAAVEGYELGTDTVTIQGSRCTVTAAFPWSIDE